MGAREEGGMMVGSPLEAAEAKDSAAGGGLDARGGPTAGGRAVTGGSCCRSAAPLSVLRRVGKAGTLLVSGVFL